MKPMPHSIKIGRFNTKRMCSRCGYVFKDDEALYDHQQETGHQSSAVIEVDEKLVDVISILTQKGYYVKSYCQGGWPDYFRHVKILGDKKEYEDKPIDPERRKENKPKRFMLEFRMNPSMVKQKKFSKKITPEQIELYTGNYWEWVGNMINTLPNAFLASFEYESLDTTLPRATIRNAKPKSRNLKITWNRNFKISWVPELSPKALGSDEEFEAMMNYGYKKLLEWAQELPDINKFMLDNTEEDK